MKTALYGEHSKLGAKIVNFAGWQMPLQYEGILKEHKAVRSKAGIFDVSHMGAIHIQGKGAEAFLNYLSANLITGKTRKSATYTILCNEQGGCVDDTLVYKLEEDHFFIVANASNRQKDLDHLKKYAAGYSISLDARFQDHGILALQGPDSIAILRNVIPDGAAIKPMQVLSLEYENTPIILSGTGYTGELGVEIFAPNEILPNLWTAILANGAKACGLGSRDTLRLEKGYALYGHELSDAINPLESVASWVVKLKNHDFLGKESLKDFQYLRSAYGLAVQGAAIAREGCAVLKNEQIIGNITSGNFSPVLNCPIALFLSHQKLKENEEVDVMIREKLYTAVVAPLPFI